MKFNKILFLSLFLCMPYFSVLHAEDDNQYKIRQGDVLDISVWGDDTLKKVIRVLPDGSISFPLAGNIRVAGFSSFRN